jgi:hypothetical protein
VSYPLGVQKFIELFARENALTYHEVIETVAIDWFAGGMAKMRLLGEKLDNLSPFIQDRETGERMTGERLFSLRYQKWQEELLAEEVNWKRHLEHVDQIQAGLDPVYEVIVQEMISEFKVLTGDGFTSRQELKPEDFNSEDLEDHDRHDTFTIDDMDKIIKK